MSGPFEPSNQPYAIAKIAGLSLSASYTRQYGRDYRALMPCNLYGPQDSFDGDGSHVVPALIRRFHDARVQGKTQVKLWAMDRHNANSCMSMT